MGSNYIKSIALGGVLAALAVVIMCLGGLIPFATYACPALCMVLLSVVVTMCGKRIAWAWYGTVSILSILMCPDREAAVIYMFIGYYPIIKLFIDKRLLPWLWKMIYFNTTVFMAYMVLIHLLGMTQISAEFSTYGEIFAVVLIALGNLTLFILDVVLSRIKIKAGR